MRIRGVLGGTVMSRNTLQCGCLDHSWVELKGDEEPGRAQSTFSLWGPLLEILALALPIHV